MTLPSLLLSVWLAADPAASSSTSPPRAPSKSAEARAGRTTTGATTTSDRARENTATAKARTAGSRSRRVIRLDAITVEGRIQKPEAFYILQRSNLTLGELRKTERFSERIDEAITAEPF